jgi:hypothetical protein
MGSGLLMALATAVTAALLVVLLAVVVASSRSRRRLEQELAASREDLAEVQRRLDGLAGQVAEPVPDVRRAVTDPQEFVITTAGEPEQDVAPTPAPQVSGREFASLALGESLVRLVSLGYGVRRALSAENRNRIAFEVKREVRRSRKQRRREEKLARQHLRSAGRHQEVDAVAEDAA